MLASVKPNKTLVFIQVGHGVFEPKPQFQEMGKIR